MREALGRLKTRRPKRSWEEQLRPSGSITVAVSDIRLDREANHSREWASRKAGREHISPGTAFVEAAIDYLWFWLELGERFEIPGVHSFVSTAEAIIGRPLTPMSNAGVARRTARLCAVGVYYC